MFHPPALLVALALGASSAGLLACGESENPSLIASSRADQLSAALDDVQATVEAGNCEATQQALTRLEQRIGELPSRTDQALVNRLEDGAQNLRERAQTECFENQTETTPTETVPPETTETTPTETTETTPTETTPTETTPTETTPPEETPPPEEVPPPDQDDGGAQPLPDEDDG
jgi:hypothetical protein